MRTIIIGRGEIGKSLDKVLSKEYPTSMIDKDDSLTGKFDIAHICFPYSENFVDIVKDYQSKYSPEHTVIHSTVPVGTSRKLNAIHSPCVGIHPHLEESLETFTKFLSGEDASQVADYFRRAGIKVSVTNRQETTELMKIMSTSFYGVCVEYTKEVKRLCDENNVPFESWTLWTNNYNKGYDRLGYPEYSRPNLVPLKKKIGGHCVLPNLEFLDSEFGEFINKLNRDKE